jgi:hypothetical protein
MWRAVRTDLDVSANLELLRKLGHSESDLAWFRPKLDQVWQLPGAKGLGMLDADVRERIAEVEKEFVRFYRSTRRFDETGIRPATGPLHSRSELNALWRKAMIEALSYEEMRDYGLARSEEAKRVERLTQGLHLTSVEHRELIRMAREFGDRDNEIARPRPTMRAFYEARLDYYSGIRALLGDTQFVTYLERADEEFLVLRRTVGDKIPPTVALDIFWLHEKTAITVRKPGLSYRERQREGELVRQEVGQILGPVLFAEYGNSEHGRWMFPR